MKIRAGVLFLVGVAFGSSLVHWWPAPPSKKQDLALSEKKSFPPSIPSSVPLPPTPGLPVLQKADPPWGSWEVPKSATSSENLDAPPPAWGWKVPSHEQEQRKTWGWEVVPPAEQVPHRE